MEHLFDVETFAKMLTDKGYDGYFQTESCCNGRIKDSISTFLELWHDRKEAPVVAGYLHLSTYLQWNGEEKPRVECNMWARYDDGKFNLQQTEMYVRQLSRYGGLLKQCKLTGLTADTLPTVREALALVCEERKENLSAPGRKLRM